MYYYENGFIIHFIYIFVYFIIMTLLLLYLSSIIKMYEMIKITHGLFNI